MGRDIKFALSCQSSTKAVRRRSDFFNSPEESKSSTAQSVMYDRGFNPSIHCDYWSKIHSIIIHSFYMEKLKILQVNSHVSKFSNRNLARALENFKSSSSFSCTPFLPPKQNLCFMNLIYDDSLMAVSAQVTLTSIDNTRKIFPQ